MLIANDRVIMISGANRGIGLAIAERLGQAGYRLSLGARDPKMLNTHFGVPDQRRHHDLYVAEDRKSHSAWVENTLKQWNRIDGLINVAGITGGFTLEEGDENELDRVWAVNCKGPLFLTRLCLPHLRVCGHGRIVNMSSLSGKRVRGDNVAYNMSKHALMALSHNTRRVGWKDGIRVTTICPSFVRTEMTATVTEIPREEMIDPNDLAELAATALALPNNAAMAEMYVNCRLEDQF